MNSSCSTSVGHRWPIFVSFDLPAKLVDQLIVKTHGTQLEAAKWFVFGTDMKSLGRLDIQWRGVMELVIICAPTFDNTMIDIALTILANEDSEPGRCIWLDGTGFASKPSCLCERVIRVDGHDADGIVFELLH